MKKKFFNAAKLNPDCSKKRARANYFSIKQDFHRTFLRDATKPAKSSEGSGSLHGAKLHGAAFLSHDTEQKFCGGRHSKRQEGLWKGFPLVTAANCLAIGVLENRCGTRIIWSGVSICDSC